MYVVYLGLKAKKKNQLNTFKYRHQEAIKDTYFHEQLNLIELSGTCNRIKQNYGWNF